MEEQAIDLLEKEARNVLSSNLYGQMINIERKLKEIVDCDPDPDARERAADLLRELTERSPQGFVHSKEATELIKRADEAFYSARFLEAIEYYQQVLRIEPQWDRALYNLKQAREYLETGRLPEALLPPFAAREYGMAKSAFTRNEFMLALEHGQRAVEQAYESGIVRWNEGEDFLAKVRNALAVEKAFSEFRILIDRGYWKEANEWLNDHQTFWEDTSPTQRRFLEQFRADYDTLRRLNERVKKIGQDLENTSAGELEEIQSRLEDIVHRYPSNEAVIALSEDLSQLHNRRKLFEDLLQKAETEKRSRHFGNASELLKQAQETLSYPSAKLQNDILQVHTLLTLQQKYYELMGRGRHACDVEDYTAAIEAFTQAEELIRSYPDLVPEVEKKDSETLRQAAETLLKELTDIQSRVIDAQRVLQEGDSCTAVDILLRQSQQPPKGQQAKSLYEEARKLKNKALVLCAEKISERGGYSRARAILEPYADENSTIQRALEKITSRQNREMVEKAEQKKDLMEELKKQCKVWFLLGVIASIMGGLLLIGGAIGAFFGKVSAALLTSISAILPGLFAALFYNHSDKLRLERVNLINKTALEEALDNKAQEKAIGLTDKPKKGKRNVNSEVEVEKE